MHPRRRFPIALLIAIGLLAGACSDDSGTPEPSTTQDTTAGDTGDDSETAAPEGTYLLVRYQVDDEAPAPLPPGQDYVAGFAMARLWDIDPRCDGDGPCDLTVSGGREDGQYALEDLEVPDAPPPDIDMDWDGDSWVSEESLPDYGQCVQEDGSYSSDYLLDVVITDTLTAEDGSGVLRGTRTESYTLSTAGEAAGVCASPEPGAAEVYNYDIVAAPYDETGVTDEGIRFEGDYAATIDVVGETGTNGLEPLTTFVQAPDFWDTFTGDCGPDSCAATFRRAYPDNPDEPTEIDLQLDDGVLTGSTMSTAACFDAPAASGEQGPLLTEDGYEATSEVENRPVWVDDGQVMVSVTRLSRSLEPTADAAAQYPDACGTPETGDYWYYQVSTDLLP